MNILEKIDRHLNEMTNKAREKKVKEKIGKTFTDGKHTFTIVKYQESNFPVLATRDDGVEYPSKFKSARKEWEFPIDVLTKAK